MAVEFIWPDFSILFFNGIKKECDGNQKNTPVLELFIQIKK